jgi:hypothetical protein
MELTTYEGKYSIHHHKKEGAMYNLPANMFNFQSLWNLLLILNV